MAGQNLAIPDINALNQYSVNQAGKYEGVRQKLYDFQVYAAAGQTQLNFFQVPVGQASKTFADTNMDTAGVLPSPKKFLIQSIEIFFFPGVSPLPAIQVTAPAVVPNFTNDNWVVSKSGFLELNIGSKNYLREAPLGEFPPKTHLNSSFGGNVSNTTATTANAITMEMTTWGGRPYFVQPALLLEPTQNFSVSLNWPVAIALPSGVAGRIGIKMDGILYRLSQ